MKSKCFHDLLCLQHSYFCHFLKRGKEERRREERRRKGTVPSVCLLPLWDYRQLFNLTSYRDRGTHSTHQALDFTFNTLGSLLGLPPHLWPFVLPLCFTLKDKTLKLKWRLVQQVKQTSGWCPGLDRAAQVFIWLSETSHFVINTAENRSTQDTDTLLFVPHTLLNITLKTICYNHYLPLCCCLCLCFSDSLNSCMSAHLT